MHCEQRDCPSLVLHYGEVSCRPSYYWMKKNTVIFLAQHLVHCPDFTRGLKYNSPRLCVAGAGQVVSGCLKAENDVELELKRFCGKLWTLDGSWPASAAFRGKSVSGDSSKVGPWQIGLDWGSRFDWGSGQGNGFGWALWSLAGSMHSVSARFRGRLALAATAWPVTFVAIWFCLTLVQPSPCGSNRKTSEGSQPCWKPDWSIFRIKGPALIRVNCGLFVDCSPAHNLGAAFLLEGGTYMICTYVYPGG